jgi:hypothetical protein
MVTVAPFQVFLSKCHSNTFASVLKNALKKKRAETPKRIREYQLNANDERSSFIRNVCHLVNCEIPSHPYTSATQLEHKGRT